MISSILALKKLALSIENDKCLTVLTQNCFQNVKKPHREYLFGYKNLSLNQNLICLTKKFHNCHHAIQHHLEAWTSNSKNYGTNKSFTKMTAAMYKCLEKYVMQCTKSVKFNPCKDKMISLSQFLISI